METKWSVVLVAFMLAVAAVALGCDEEVRGDPADAGEQDLESPLVTMDNVVLFQDVFGAFDVEVTATDDVGIETVELLVNGDVAATSTADPFTISWDTTAAADGLVSVAVRASDLSGNTAETEPVDVVVLNDGYVVEFTDGSSGAMSIPDPYVGSEEVDKKHHWMSADGGASRYLGIALLTAEEGQADWEIGLDIGTGFCPDSGDTLDSMTTTLDGEPVVFDSQIEAGYPGGVQMFFHLRPMNPTEHLGESLGYEFKLFSFN